MSQGWTTIFMGPPGEAEALRAGLEARGIPTFIPDDAIRTIDPLAFGGLLVFDRALQVPPSAVAQARAYLDGLDDAEIREGEQELPSDFFEVEPEPDAELSARVAGLSRRIRWASLFPLALPWLVVQFFQYLRLVERMEQPPPLHRTTVAMASLAPVIAAIVFWLIFRDELLD